MSTLPILCDQRGSAGCCGVPACQTAGIWTIDPYDEPVVITTPSTQAHVHSEPVCAWPECQTYLTRSQMATIRNVSPHSDTSTSLPDDTLPCGKPPNVSSTTSSTTSLTTSLGNDTTP